MKNRTNKIVLAVFLLSLAFLFLLYGILQKLPFPPSELTCLFYVFSAVPAFCLQLLLCRTVRHWIAAVPTVILVGAVLFFTYGLFTTFGWDSLGYAIFLALSAAPAAGCALAWAVYGIARFRKRSELRG